jgi:hypothetical protein
MDSNNLNANTNQLLQSLGINLAPAIDLSQFGIDTNGANAGQQKNNHQNDTTNAG